MTTHNNMKGIVLLFSLSFPCFAEAQPLSFDSTNTGFYPTYCRQFYFQNGNGVVYAAATGGSPPYYYEWTYLVNSQTSSNSTWGGLNPGDYEIKIWDAANDSISQIIFLDSLNPIANFSVVSSGLTPLGNKFIGSAPVSVSFINQSINGTDPNDPGSDTLFFWKMTQFQAPYLVQTNATQNYTYNYGGDWYVQLEVVNGNGCSSVLTKHLDLSGPAGVEAIEQSETKVFFSADKEQIIVEIPVNSISESITFYDLAGRHLFSNIVQPGINLITNVLNKEELIFVITAIDGTKLHSGKLF